MPLTAPNGHGLRAGGGIEGMREWRRKKWRLNRELATEMMPSMYVGRPSEKDTDESFSADRPDALPDWTWARCHAHADFSPAHR